MNNRDLNLYGSRRSILERNSLYLMIITLIILRSFTNQNDAPKVKQIRSGRFSCFRVIPYLLKYFFYFPLKIIKLCVEKSITKNISLLRLS